MIQIEVCRDPEHLKYLIHTNASHLFEYSGQSAYLNNEAAVYSYDAWNQLIELDEYDLGGKKTYTWDAEGNRLTEMQYNHGQSGQSNSGNSGNNGNRW